MWWSNPPYVMYQAQQYDMMIWHDTRIYDDIRLHYIICVLSSHLIWFEIQIQKYTRILTLISLFMWYSSTGEPRTKYEVLRTYTRTLVPTFRKYHTKVLWLAAFLQQYSYEWKIRVHTRPLLCFCVLALEHGGSTGGETPRSQKSSPARSVGVGLMPYTGTCPYTP